jgi:hypothetical protein
LEVKDAPLQLQAIMHWPHDERARKHFFVTAAAKAMQTAEDVIPGVADEFVDGECALQRPQVATRLSGSSLIALA